MKRFPKRWVLQAGALLILGFASVPMVRAIEQGPSGEFEIVESSRPDGKGGYRGKVTIQQHGPSFGVDWKLKSGEAYTGVGILNGDVLGVGYGNGLSLAVYQIQGGTLTAKWLLSATPEQVGEYQLTGPASLNGVCRFANGTKGNVTIKPNGDSYEIVWNCPAALTAEWALKWAILWWRFPVARINCSGRSLIRFPVNVY